MSLLEMTVKHGRTCEEARQALEHAVNDVRARFGAMIDKVEWSEDRNAVLMSGTGCTAEIRVTALDVHVRADVPFLSGLLGAPVVEGLKQIIHRNFQKQLTGPKQ
ncbi:hypothetical protein AYO40_00085 [Planctomycetaceae bacterium SCGC AG-212-D15]|nr:hypothetical protein AYO40_00085 [Planctomycetaceae bacterium SCGC AG-212-D15]